MKTEEDARKCWCPFARVSSTGLGNRYPMDTDLAEGSAFARCIASECMAWRWVFQAPETKYQQGEPEGAGWKLRSTETLRLSRPNNWERPVAPTHGYCGLSEPTECYGGCNYS